MRKQNKISKLLGFIACIVLIFSLYGCSSFNDNKIEKHFGETFTFRGIDITVDNYVFKRYAIDKSFSAGENKVWLVINVTLYNATTKAKNLNVLADDIIYQTEEGDAEYNGEWYFYGDWIRTHSEIDPFETISGMFTYLVPENIAPELGEYDYKIGYYFSASSTQNINFEFRIYENSILRNECFVIKL